MDKKSLLEATGGIWIGNYLYFCFQASSPFGKIEVYEDEVIFRIQNLPKLFIKSFELFGKITFLFSNLPKEIHLPYTNIQRFKTTNLGPLGYGIRFIHNIDQYPPVLIIWIWPTQAEEVIKYLTSKITPTTQI
ncbi:MAG: hypothetical protein Q8R55_07605 [Candidatus Taylorbacteria bacterium]|nr:hypothetical protein [Candidatus Taylorbacteria bacterium]